MTLRTVRPAGENAYLCYEIQKLNRHSEGLFDLIRRCLETVEAATPAGDPRGFVDLMQRGRDYFPETMRAELK